MYTYKIDKYPDLYINNTKQSSDSEQVSNQQQPESSVSDISSPIKIVNTNKKVEKPKSTQKKKAVKTAPTQLSVTTKFEGNADDINKHLDGVLNGHGDKFLELQDKYGINAAFLAAIVMSECDNGRSKRAKRTYNVASIRYKNSKKFRTYESVDLCLEDMASLLKRKYIDEGRTTVASIGSKYAPVTDPTDVKNLNRYWPRNVAIKMNKIVNTTSEGTRATALS